MPINLKNLSSLPRAVCEPISIKNDSIEQPSTNIFFRLFTLVRNSRIVVVLIPYKDQQRSENRQTTKNFMIEFTKVYGNDARLSSNRNLHDLLIDGRKALTLDRLHQAVNKNNKLMTTRAAEISAHLAQNESTQPGTDAKDWMLDKMVKVFGIHTPVRQRHVEFLLCCHRMDINSNEYMKELSAWVSAEEQGIDVEAWIAPREAERNKNTAAWDRFNSDITAEYGDSMLSDFGDVLNKLSKNNRARYLMGDGRLEFTDSLETQIIDHYKNKREVWIRQKMPVAFGDAEATARHSEFLQYCSKLGINNDTHIRLLSGWISQHPAMTLHTWINECCKAELAASFSAFTEALTPDQSPAAMLDGLYRFCDATYLMAIVEKQEFGIDARSKWQKNYVLQQLQHKDSQQIKAIVKNLMSHQWAPQVMAFMLQKPGIVMNNIADTIKTNEQALSKVLHAWNQPAVLVSIADACAERLDGDTQKQVDNWMKERISASYGRHFGLINQDFYASLSTIWKTQFGLDLEKTMPLQTISKTFDMTKPGLSFDLIIGEPYKEYQHFLKQMGYQRSLIAPRAALKKSLAAYIKRSGKQVIASIRQGMHRICVTDLIRASYRINDIPLPRTSENEAVTAFKQQLPDANEQLLVSCFAHQGIFPGLLVKINDMADFLPKGVKLNSLGEATYHIHKGKEHSIKLTVTSDFNLKENKMPFCNMNVRLELDLITLTATASYTFTPDNEVPE